MSTKANPPIGTISSTNIKLDSEFGRKQLLIILNQLWQRTGGGNDAVADANQRELFPWNHGVTSEIDSQLNALFISGTKNPVYYSSQNANYTATDYEFINASGGITVTLPEYPSENSTVSVRNSDGSKITISGNGNNVDGKSSIITARKGTLLDLIYLIDSGEWVIQ